MVQIVLRHADTSPWTTPGDWNPANNTVELIGPGGDGTASVTDVRSGAGGGGGAYQRRINLAAGTYNFRVPAGGSGLTTRFGNDGASGTNYFGAQFGATAITTTGGTAGSAIQETGGTPPGSTGASFAGGGGGNGRSSTTQSRPGGGGGGSGGPLGAGANGGNAANAADGGGGGGGSNNGTAGTGTPNPTATNGAVGGASGIVSSTGGVGATTGAAATSGTLGAGGGGGATATNIVGAAGSVGDTWGSSVGPGGGGGGGGATKANANGGGSASTYGGGGGGAGLITAAGTAGIAGPGGDGLIVITYTPVAVIGSATGIGTATAVGVSLGGTGTGVATGVGTASGVGIGFVPGIGVGTATGAGVATGAGTSTGVIPGLIVRWNLGNGTGADLAGSGNTGTFTPIAIGLPTGPIGNSVLLDGSAGYVSGNQIVNVSYASVSVWVNTTSSATNAWMCGFLNGILNNVYDKDLTIGTSHEPVWTIYNGAYVSVHGPAPINDGNWHFIVGTYEEGAQNLYVDAVAGTPSATTGASYTGYNVNNIFLGGNTNDLNWLSSFPTFDDFRVYDRALTAGEVTTLYSERAGGNPIGTASATGTGTAAGVGAALSTGVGSATGDGAVTGFSTGLIDRSGVGTATGIGTATGAAGGVLKTGVGTATGHGTATGVPRTGLIVRWALGNGTGADLVGSGDTGSFHGGATPTQSGPIGNGVIMDGVTGYVDSSLVVNIPYASVSVWVNTTDTTTNAFMCGFLNGLLNNVFDKDLTIGLSHEPVWSVYNGTVPAVHGPAAINDGHWHLIVGTYESGALILYVDGVAGTPNGASGPSYEGYNVNNVFLGGDTSATNWLAATYDDFRVYNRAITAAEVAALYAEGTLGTFGAGSATGVGTGTGISTGGAIATTGVGSATGVGTVAGVGRETATGVGAAAGGAAALTLTVNPTMPTIPDTTPLGTVVATLQGVWSNGATFVGTYAFVAPNFDDGGIYAISGSNLIVSLTGPGVGSQGGSVDHVTVEAVGFDPSVAAVGTSSFANSGTATGVGTALGVGTRLSAGQALGSATGLGTVSGVGRATDTGVGVATGVGTAAAVGLPLKAGVGTAIGGSPALTVSVNPTMPTIPDTTPKGTTVATLQGLWSNSAPFVGTYAFVAPNFNDGGIYAITLNVDYSGSLIVSQTGPGVGAEGGSVDHVTVEAVAFDPSVTGVGIATDTGIGAATGVGTVTSTATARDTGIGSATGIGTAAGAATFLTPPSQGIANSIGVGGATAIGVATDTGVGAATGVGVVAGVGASVTTGVGAATGVGTAAAVGIPLKSGVGSATGVGTAASVGISTVAVVGIATGVGTASSSNQILVSATGIATGDSIVVGQSPARGIIPIFSPEPSPPGTIVFDFGEFLRDDQYIVGAFQIALNIDQRRFGSPLVITSPTSGLPRQALQVTIYGNTAISRLTCVANVNDGTLATAYGIAA